MGDEVEDVREVPAEEGMLRSPTEAVIGGTRRVTLGYSEGLFGLLPFCLAYQSPTSLVRLAYFLSPSAYPLGDAFKPRG